MPPQGMSAEERADEIVKLGNHSGDDCEWVRSLVVSAVAEAEAAARADERAKWIDITEPSRWKGWSGSAEEALKITQHAMKIKLSEAQPVEPSEGEGT